MVRIASALIRFRQGQKVKWQVPSGKKTFTIMEVVNDLN
jgi:regulator of nucleoside diphosphate kinase